MVERTIPQASLDLHTGMEKVYEREETGREMLLIPALKRQKQAEVEASQGLKKKRDRSKIMHSKFGVKPRQLLACLTLS